MWIYDCPSNYSEMIQKISKSITFILFIMLYILSLINAEFSEFLRSISLGGNYEFFGIKVNLATFYLPLLMGISEHIFKIHDKISNICGIRRRYDKNVIVAMFLRELKFTINACDLSDHQVERIMSVAFYKYASSTKPAIDTHFILLALNEWCWFWIVLDTTVLLGILAIPFMLFNFSWSSALFILCLLGIMLLLMLLIRIQIKTYTIGEVHVILCEAKRKEEIMGDISNALTH